MTAIMSEYEFETLPEYEFEDEDEGEYEDEWEGEYEDEWEDEGEFEGEAEAEAFFGQLASLARRAASSPALRKVGLAAARSALRSAGRVGQALGGAAAGGTGAKLGQALGNQLGQVLGTLLPQQEYEGEYEDEYEVNPIARIYPDVLMEHLGHAAANAESEAEAEAFVGALLPVAARLAGAGRVMSRVGPQLTRGLTSAAKTLRSTPGTRPLVRTLPTVARRTMATLQRQAAHGQPITPQRAARTLARQTARVVGNPRQAVSAYRRSRAMDHRYHRVTAQGRGALATLRPPMRGIQAGRPGTRRYVRGPGQPAIQPGRRYAGPRGQMIRSYGQASGRPIMRPAIARGGRAVRQVTEGVGTCNCGAGQQAVPIMAQPIAAQPVMAQPIIAQPAMCDCATLQRICPNCGGMQEF